jgi:hypothetical protein
LQRRSIADAGGSNSIRGRIVFYMLYVLRSGYRERRQLASAGLAESRASSRE